MSNKFVVSLSYGSASEVWGKNALVSFLQDQAVIHLDKNKSLTRQVQLAARKFDSMAIEEIKLQGEQWSRELCWAFSQGFYNAKNGAKIEYPDLNQEDKKLLASQKHITEWVRDIINTGPNALSPEDLCEKAFLLIQDVKPEHVDVHYKIRSGEALLRFGFHGIYNVGKGSGRPPCMLIMDYNPTGNDDAPVDYALVGKGITFDSGGYSLKPSNSMATMKSDMGGAATLAGALALAITNGLNKRVKLYLCCADNLISGNALKLGDVITYKNGMTVEVLNTDAEGRLVLADGLIAAQESDPVHIIDAATLTGAAKVAVGREYNALLTMDNQFAQRAAHAAEQENEMLWRLPFADFHLDQVNSSFADIANIHSGEGKAGASTAAAFLAKFIEKPETNWLHFDLSGSYQASANALWSTGAKGHGVSTISHLLLS